MRRYKVKYFLEKITHNEFYFMTGSVLKEKDGEILAFGDLYFMKDHLRNPQLNGINVQKVFYNSFDTFDELLEHVSKEYDRKKNNMIENLTEVKDMVENIINKNKHDYIKILNKIENQVLIHNEDYKRIEILRDLALQVGAFEDNSNIYISFDTYHFIVTSKRQTKKIRYDKYNIVDIDELYYFLFNKLKIVL